MSLTTLLLCLVIISPSVHSLSLVKLNESQKVGLPSFMYSHFNISDVSGVADVMQNFFSNFKDSISEYVDKLSGSADDQEVTVEEVSAESQKNVVKEAAKQDVETKKVEVEEPKVVNTVQQKVKPEEKGKVPVESQKQIQNGETLPQKVVKTEQKNPNNVQKENVQNTKTLPQKISPVNANQPNKEPNTANKLNNKPSEKPSPDVKKINEIRAGQNTNNQKGSVNKVIAKPADQQSKTPELFSMEATRATSKLESLIRTLEQHLQKVKVSALISQAVSQYNIAVQSSEGSKCVPPGGESRVEQVLETCVDAVLQVQKKSIAEALEKVKDLDYNLRLTYDLCSSLKEPPSAVCDEATSKYLNSINDVVSQVELEKVNDLAVKDVESCVEAKAEDLMKWIKQINDCRVDIQEL